MNALTLLVTIGVITGSLVSLLAVFGSPQGILLTVVGILAFVLIKLWGKV